MLDDRLSSGMKLMHRYGAGDQELFRKHSGSLDTLSYVYKPSYPMLWDQEEEIHIYEGKEGLYVYQRASDTFLMPFSRDMEKAVKELEWLRGEEGLSSPVAFIPDNYSSFFPKASRDMDSDEYLYYSEKLIRLSGKHLQAKRNHISQFERSFTYSFQALGKNDFDECIDLDRSWEEEKDQQYIEELEHERKAIRNAFDSWDSFGFSGATIKIDGRIIAFTVGEKVSDKEGIIHFEKADTSYIGSYATINHHFIATYFSDLETINRQEDMGVEGMRKAKKSYHPYRMLEMWRE